MRGTTCDINLKTAPANAHVSKRLARLLLKDRLDSLFVTVWTNLMGWFEIAGIYFRDISKDSEYGLILAS